VPLSRRSLLRAGLASVALVPGQRGWRDALAAGEGHEAGPYGPLSAPDAHGLCLPAGFSARLLGVSGERVSGTDYRWHGAPDGGACFGVAGGGWVYVSNAELESRAGGAGALRFDARGEPTGGYTILHGTSRNCAGGPTPWQTWLSCEETPDGLVWECDPFRPGQGVPRPALGRFMHEAAAVDPRSGFVYLTEDERDGHLYRFRPRRPRDLAQGILEVAQVDVRGGVRWHEVPPERPHAAREATAFDRGEGAWFSAGVLYFCTTGDHRVWTYEPAAARLAVLYDAARAPAGGASLRDPDNVTVHAATGDVFVAEDADDLELVLLSGSGRLRGATPFLRLVGHSGSEVAGPAFSPDGRRLYFSSQRGTGGRYGDPGMTFEIVGPFRDT
jgi:uncharacterized protein